MTSGPLVLFDQGPLPGGTLFDAPHRLIEARTAEEVAPALAAMEQAQAAGQWLAGSASYELGYVLSPKLAPRLPPDRREPLLRFGVFDAPRPPDPDPAPQPCGLGPLVPDWSRATYARAFDRVHAYLASGDIYQANLTMPLRGHLTGDAFALYTRLRARQPVPFGAYLDLGGMRLLSRSPELFFAMSATGQLRTRPMKGTMRRGATPDEDAALKAALAASDKNRAENLMITDLLRNDFGRIARIGSVRVPQLFAVETYATVHQMVSEVTAEILPGMGLADILAAVFPCGSITGAPKIRAMEIIAELEPTPRGSYCGAIGWIAPDGAMEFSVAIRTLICDPDGGVTLNVGGGLVHDSTAEGEYDEALLKASFATL